MTSPDIPAAGRASGGDLIVSRIYRIQFNEPNL